MRWYVIAALAVAALTVLALASHALYSSGYQAGENACKAKAADAAVKVDVEIDRRAQASADASQSMLDYLAANLPPIETRTNAAIERTRIVYRDRPVPAVCEWPDGVRKELDEARARANATAATR